MPTLGRPLAVLLAAVSIVALTFGALVVAVERLPLDEPSGWPYG